MVQMKGFTSSPTETHRMPSLRSGPRRIWIATFGCLALIWIFFTSSRGSSPRMPSFGSLTNSQGAGAPYNRTLGFGAILMAVLPQRTDQLDTVALLSHYSEIDIIIVDGVPKDEIVEKALPKGTYRPEGGQLGCWRAHLNMLRMVVDLKLETALLLEADVDWDIRIKDQLAGVSKHIHDATPERPYGLSWLFFWFGHCFHGADPSALGPFTSYPDETVAPWSKQTEWAQADAKLYGVTEDGHRVIHKAHHPLCTSSYAVTLKGALRMLYEIGYDHLDGPIDKEYQKATARGKLPGLVLLPPIIGQWRTGTALDSDINDSKPKINLGHDVGGSGPHVEWSARRNLKDWTYANDTSESWMDPQR